MKKEIILGEIRADWFLGIMRHTQKHGLGNCYGKMTDFCYDIYNHKIFKKNKINISKWKIKISLVNRCEYIDEKDYGLDD